MKKYTCKEARKDVRFVYSKKAEETPNLVKKAFERFLNHSVRHRKGGGIIFCSRCLEYHHKEKIKHGF